MSYQFYTILYQWNRNGIECLFHEVQASNILGCGRYRGLHTDNIILSLTSWSLGFSPWMTPSGFKTVKA